MDKVPVERFNLGYWADEYFPAETAPEQLGENECATVACACGWASVLFADEGLRLVFTSSVSHVKVLVPFYKGLTDWYAIELFFDIDEDTAKQLFTPEYYDTGDETTPTMVADKLRKVVVLG